MKAPCVKQTLISALESGMVLTNGLANEMTMSSEGSRTLRRLVHDGYPIETRKRPNKIRSGSVKEYFYSEETLKEIRDRRVAELES